MPRLEYMRALMPPWYGTEEENAALTAYLMSLKAGSRQPGPTRPRHEPGTKAFALSCGLCHTPTASGPWPTPWRTWTAEEIDEFLDEVGDLTDEMPGYFGPARAAGTPDRIPARNGQPDHRRAGDEGSAS